MQINESTEVCGLLVIFDLLFYLQVFDLDHNGYISPVELRTTMAELGIALSDDDVALMMSLADTDGDGLINYEGGHFTLSTRDILLH